MFKVLMLGVLVWQQVIEDVSGQQESKPKAAHQRVIFEITGDDSRTQQNDLPIISVYDGGSISSQNVNGAMRYLKFNSSLATWNGARHQCIREGGHLAVIRSESEAEIFNKLFPKAESIRGAWVGYHDRFEEGDWTTVLDEPASDLGWFEWTTMFNSPDNNKGNEHCAQLMRYGGLDDYICEHLKPFVCETSG